MLTGDDSIVDAQAIVQYRVKDPTHSLFRVRDPDQALRDSTEVAIRSVIGRTTIDEAMTVGRLTVQTSAHEFLQQLLDAYDVGLLVTKLQVVDPPEQVKDAFHEVVWALEDRERLFNVAKGYQEDVIPRARGEAERMLRAAKAYKEQREIRASGGAAKFVTIVGEYEKAPEVTEQRLYVETLQRVLPKAQKIIISPQEEAAKLRAETDKQHEIIIARAYEQSQRLQGDGDAAAASIYASASEQHPRFYIFTHTLEAYDDILNPETLLVLPGDAAMVRLLSGPPSME
jgi:HflK protein